MESGMFKGQSHSHCSPRLKPRSHCANVKAKAKKQRRLKIISSKCYSHWMEAKINWLISSSLFRSLWIGLSIFYFWQEIVALNWPHSPQRWIERSDGLTIWHIESLPGTVVEVIVYQCFTHKSLHIHTTHARTHTHTIRYPITSALIYHSVPLYWGNHGHFDIVQYNECREWIRTRL